MREDEELEWSPRRSLAEILSALLGEGRARELAEELYGLGLYLAPLATYRDPFERAKPPAGMSYQWVLLGDAGDALSNGWVPVPASRHEGLYAPIGFGGYIELNGLMLMERDAAITNAVRAVQAQKAHKQVDDWAAKYGAMFSGHIKVGASEESATTRVLGDPVIAEKVVASTRLPASLDPSAMFTERDRLRALTAECGDIMPSPAAITARAIENIKEKAA